MVAGLNLSSDSTPQSSTGISFFQLFMLCGALSILGFVLMRHFYHDDAYISLRYAMHWVNGAGPVWNPGEFVEGYSNFLFVFLLTLLGSIGLDLVVASQALGLVSYIAIFVLVSFYLNSRDALTPSSHWRRPVSFALIVTIVLLAANLDMVVWSLGGLETVLVSGFVTAGGLAYLCYLRDGRKQWLTCCSGMFVLASLTRLDAGLFLAITSGFVVVDAVRTKRLTKMSWFFLPGLVFIPYFIGKFIYYGDFLPNTFYAKAGGISVLKLGIGTLYILAFMFAPPCWYLGIIVLSIRQRNFIRCSPELRYLLSLLGMHLVYLLYSGGDHMRAFRFFVPVVPLATVTLYLLLRVETENWLTARKKRWAAAIVVWIVGQTGCYYFFPLRVDSAAFVGRIVGEYINMHFPKNVTIALNTAGSTPYYAPENNYIDMLGLNDAHIARRQVAINQALKLQYLPGHNKGDGQYILDRAPDYIILGPAEGIAADEPQWFLSGAELAQLSDFYNNYQLKTVIIDVSARNHYRHYKPTQSGSMTFKYYQKK